jgi:hypothetical protein
MSTEQQTVEYCLKCGGLLRMGSRRVVFCPACEPGRSSKVMWCIDCHRVCAVVKRRAGVDPYCPLSNHFVSPYDAELRPL